VGGAFLIRVFLTRTLFPVQANRKRVFGITAGVGIRRQR
jgi:hypothetical protein